MRVLDAMVFFAALNGVARHVARERANELLEHFEVDPGLKVEALSKGNRAKLLMAITIIHDPELLILDEPFSGLDPVGVRVMRDIILEKKRAGASIVLSTHQMTDAEMLCDRICLINKGKRVVYGPLSEVRKAFGMRCIEVEGEGDMDSLSELGYEYEVMGNTARVYGAEQQPVLAHLLKKQVKLTSFSVSEAPLEKIFLDVVGDSNNATDD